MSAELFDPPADPDGPTCPPEAPCAVKIKEKKAKKKRGGELKPEAMQRTLDLEEAVRTKDPDVMVRAMAVALYRLGAEPLNDVAELMLNKLGGIKDVR